MASKARKANESKARNGSNGSGSKAKKGIKWHELPENVQQRILIYTFPVIGVVNAVDTKQNGTGFPRRPNYASDNNNAANNLYDPWEPDLKHLENAYSYRTRMLGNRAFASSASKWWSKPVNGDGNKSVTYHYSARPLLIRHFPSLILTRNGVRVSNMQAGATLRIRPGPKDMNMLKAVSKQFRNR